MERQIPYIFSSRNIFIFFVLLMYYCNCVIMLNKYIYMLRNSDPTLKLWQFRGIYDPDVNSWPRSVLFQIFDSDPTNFSNPSYLDSLAVVEGGTEVQHSRTQGTRGWIQPAPNCCPPAIEIKNPRIRIWKICEKIFLLWYMGITRIWESQMNMEILSVKNEDHECKKKEY